MLAPFPLQIAPAQPHLKESSPAPPSPLPQTLALADAAELDDEEEARAVRRQGPARASLGLMSVAERHAEASRVGMPEAPSDNGIG